MELMSLDECLDEEADKTFQSINTTPKSCLSHTHTIVQKQSLPGPPLPSAKKSTTITLPTHHFTPNLYDTTTDISRTLPTPQHLILFAFFMYHLRFASHRGGAGAEENTSMDEPMITRRTPRTGGTTQLQISSFTFTSACLFSNVYAGA